MSKIDYSVPPETPWRNDVQNTCAKCGSYYYLQQHHITYSPEHLVYLCVPCHAKITGVNAKGSLVARGNTKTRVEYTNKLRLVLWDWFINTQWPVTRDGVPVRRISKTHVKEILHDAKFKIERLSKNESKQHCTAKQPRRSRSTTQPSKATYDGTEAYW